MRVGDHASLDEIDEHIGYDAAVHAELAMVRKRAATAAGSVPIPSWTVARSGMSAATCSATERSTAEGSGSGMSMRRVVAFDQDVDVLARQPAHRRAWWAARD